ncbi:hypothetical protein [Methylobacterium nodulans]|uniref:Uncharacterized protein n=1 Tax=Methylobacterium nodulans (strain LMG 21967 / CNCM I-2342 / ORS 2060) TaxID=460265 RepID=B8IAG0_METNO|nr:hypothetical protein [Methylobacterium nodulans]ACL59223.1 conserved hypothetical protein [Methylobacterium nodulans ORS 2060]
MEVETRARVIETALMMIAKYLHDKDPNFRAHVNAKLDAQIMTVASKGDRADAEKDAAVDFFSEVRRLLNPGR